VTAAQIRDVDKLRNAILNTPFPAEFIERLLSTSEIELRYVCDWLGWDRQSGIELISLLMRKNAFFRHRNGYRKNPQLIEILKSMQAEAIDKRPSHIPEF
jgi:hypothetical protein